MKTIILNICVRKTKAKTNETIENNSKPKCFRERIKYNSPINCAGINTYKEKLFRSVFTPVK
jgi:hypothetical protein